MVVQIEAGPLTTSGERTTAQATRVRVQRALVGQPGAVDPGSGRFTVLGQTVQTDADTVFDERLAGGLGALPAAGPVEVYALFDATTGAYRATRVAPAAAALAPKVSGRVTQLDAAARTLRIGAQRYSYAAVGDLAGLAEGAELQLRLTGGTDAAGRWIVSGQGAPGPAPDEEERIELRGLVQSIGTGGRFGVDGRTVDASAARIDGQVEVGATVRVSATLRGGVLVASRVRVEQRGAPQDYELRGPIGALDVANRRFVVRGTTIGYARPDVVFVGGSAAQLAPGRRVEVSGRLSDDRSRLEAIRIEFDD
jgi:hypothetical protein